MATDPLGLAASLPVSPGAAYYVCCYKQQVSVCGGKRKIADPCLRRCALYHEAIHLDDIWPCHSDVCKGNPDKTPVTGTEAEVKASECRAWTDTWECIKQCQDSEEKRNAHSARPSESIRTAAIPPVVCDDEHWAEASAHRAGGVFAERVRPVKPS
jgi:hypothetical protein